MASKSVTLKNLTASTALLLKDLKITEDDPRYDLVIQVAGWIWLMKKYDLTTMADYPAVENDIPAIGEKLKQASKAYG